MKKIITSCGIALFGAGSLFLVSNNAFATFSFQKLFAQNMTIASNSSNDDDVFEIYSFFSPTTFLNDNVKCGQEVKPNIFAHGVSSAVTCTFLENITATYHFYTPQQPTDGKVSYAYNTTTPITSYISNRDFYFSSPDLGGQPLVSVSLTKLFGITSVEYTIEGNTTIKAIINGTAKHKSVEGMPFTMTYTYDALQLDPGVQATCVVLPDNATIRCCGEGSVQRSCKQLS